MNLVRWLRTVLILAGVNTTVLSAHSTRKESATKAVGVGSKYKPSWRLLTSALAGTLNRFYNRSSFSKGDCMAFFTKSVLSLESLELTNGQPVSKSSDMQVKTFRCTILEWLSAHSACKLFLIVMKPGVGKLITTSHPYFHPHTVKEFIAFSIFP